MGKWGLCCNNTKQNAIARNEVPIAIGTNYAYLLFGCAIASFLAMTKWICIFIPMKKFIRGFGYAFKGIGYATKTQLNFRVHLVAILVACYMGYALHISPTEWLWVALCVALVLSAELINTALELLTDLVSPDYNKLAGHVKDVAAGAVLITAIFALVTAGIIFLPKIIALIHAA